MLLIIVMAEIEGSTESEYPIWIEDNLFICDETKLRAQIMQRLNYSHTQATRLSPVVAQLLNHDVTWKQYLRSLVLMETDVSAQDVQVFSQSSFHHHQTVELLRTGDPAELTYDKGSVVHAFVVSWRNDMVELILQSLKKDDCYRILEITNVNKQTPIHTACITGNAKALLMMAQSLSQDHWFRLLQMKDGYAEVPPLHRAVFEGYREIVNIIQSTVTDGQWNQLLQMRDKFNGTPLHYTTSEGHKEIAQLITSSVTAGQWQKLLHLKDMSRRTPLHYTTLSGHVEMLINIQKSVTSYDWYQLLQMKDEYEYTPLQIAAYQGHIDMLSAVQETVNNDIWIDLLSTPLPQFSDELRWNQYGDFSKYLQAVRILKCNCLEAKVKKVYDTSKRSGMTKWGTSFTLTWFN